MITLELLNIPRVSETMDILHPRSLGPVGTTDPSFHTTGKQGLTGAETHLGKKKRPGMVKLYIRMAERAQFRKYQLPGD